MSITWKQFKDFIDVRLKERGISEEIKIEYIDISWEEETDKLTLEDLMIGIKPHLDGNILSII